ncbi:MAG: alpha/beta hydrolase [Thiohalobacterales bacterium]|nr:alpha/beta hydrolase [Thiohalobacterales bacterium]
MPDFVHDSLRIHWEIEGSGAPVALLNGVLMTTASWSLQTASLARRYQCILHDFRGQLLSSKPECSWTMNDHVEDFHALLDYLGIECCHVVGTSYGGEVGMMFAARYPHRVRSLAVIASVSEIGPDVDAPVREWRRAALEAPETLYRTMLPTTFSPAFLAANPQLAEQGEARISAMEPAFFHAFAKLIDAFLELDITAMLPDIRCPALVMTGAQDRLKPPSYSRLIADAIPRSQLVEVAGAGHAIVLEQAEVVNNTLMAFLRGQERR